MDRRLIYMSALLLATVLAAPTGGASTEPLVLLKSSVSGPCGPYLVPGGNASLSFSLLYSPGQNPAEYVVLTVAAPTGISVSPGRLVWGMGVLPGEARSFTVNLSAAKDVTPGNYTITIKALVIYVDGSTVRQNITLALEVKGCPRAGLTISKARLSPFNYPGTEGATLSLNVTNHGPEAVVNLTVEVVLPGGWSPHRAIVRLRGLAGNESATVRIGGVFVPPGTEPGNYTLRVTLNYTCTVCNITLTRSVELSTTVEVSKPPVPRLALLYAGWVDGYAAPGERNAAYRVELQLLEPWTVTGVNYSLSLPSGFEAASSQQLSGFQQLRLGYGDSFPLSFRLNTASQPGNYTGVLKLDLRVEKGDTVTWIPATVRLGFPVAERRPVLSLLQAYWSSWVAGGDRGYGLEARILILYRGSDRVTNVAVSAKPLPPAGLRAGAPRSYAHIVAAAGDASMIEVVVPGIVVPGGVNEAIVVLNLTLSLATPAGGSYVARASLEARLPVPREQPLVLLNTSTSPVVVLPGSGRVELRIVLANTAPSPVHVVSANLSGLPRGVRQLSLGGSCLDATVAPGTQCSLLFALNVSSAAPPGLHRLGAVVLYSYQGQTGVIIGRHMFPVLLSIEEPSRYVQALRLVSAYWVSPTGSPLMVLPGDANAPLQVTIYNPGPWTVQGLRLHLTGGGFNSTTGFCDAVAPGGFCTTVLYVDVPRKPGSPVLEAHYTVRVYGATLSQHAALPLRLQLASPAEAVIPVTAWWATTPTPGSRTAKLMLLVDIDPRLVSGLVSLRLLLPAGLRDPSDGDSVVVLRPAETGVGLLQALPKKLLERLKGLGGAASLSGLKYSDPLLYEATVAVEKPLRSPRAILVALWRDELSVLQSTTATLRLPSTGGAEPLLVWSSPRASMRGGVANVTVYVSNRGSVAAYNVYVYLMPLGQAAYPVRPLAYLTVLPPNTTRKIVFQLVFNPSSFAGTKTYTFSGIVAVVYDDALGYKHMFNATIASVLEPPVRVLARSLKATATGVEVTVRGSVVNLGVETAENVIVEARSGNATATYIVGSLDPGSETPFKLTLYNVSKPRSTVMVTVTYMDEYGYTYRAEYNVTPVLQPQPTAPVKQLAERHTEEPLRWTYVLAAAVSVLVATALLRRHRGGEAIPEELLEGRQLLEDEARRESTDGSSGGAS